MTLRGHDRPGRKTRPDELDPLIGILNVIWRMTDLVLESKPPDTESRVTFQEHYPISLCRQKKICFGSMKRSGGDREMARDIPRDGAILANFAVPSICPRDGKRPFRHHFGRTGPMRDGFGCRAVSSRDDM
jgi:hypothetical protein